MRCAEPDVTYSYTSASNPVTFTVEPGETFEVETVPTCGAQFDSHTGRHAPDAEGGINASTGCIGVDGATAGGLLTVHVLDVALHEYGYTRVRDESPVAPGLALEPTFKAVRIRDGLVEWSERPRLPARPLVGYIGVPRPDEVLSNAHNGAFGGNFDVPEIGAGARVHLPVFVDGARLHVGDVHAVQGDGEIDGAGGIETGARLTLRVEVGDRPDRFRNPRIEHGDWIMTTGFARPAEDAFRQALADLIRWMVDAFGFGATAAHMLLAQVLEARVTQFVNPLYTYVCKVRREYLDAG
ncbi:MAG: acetamidase/formamidase family protein [Planctomycetota bacterium]